MRLSQNHSESNRRQVSHNSPASAATMRRSRSSLSCLPRGRNMDHLSHSLSYPPSRVSTCAASNTVSFSPALLTLVPVPVYHVRINFSWESYTFSRKRKSTKNCRGCKSKGGQEKRHPKVSEQPPNLELCMNQDWLCRITSRWPVLRTAEPGLWCRG